MKAHRDARHRADPASGAVRLRTLGEMGIWTADGRRLGSVLEKPKTFALLVYLSCHPDRDHHPRDSLLAVFWPHSDSRRGGACLRQTVYVLREALPPDLIVSRRRSLVGVRFDRLDCDVRAFRSAVADGRLEAAAALYRGEFLHGFSVGRAPEVNRWVDAQQQELRRTAVDVVHSLARTAATQGSPKEALRWWNRGLDLAPYDETAAGGAVLALGALGRRAEALERCEDFVRRRVTEIGLAPSPGFETGIVHALGDDAAAMVRAALGPSTPHPRVHADEAPPGPDPFGPDRRRGRDDATPRSEPTANASL